MGSRARPFSRPQCGACPSWIRRGAALSLSKSPSRFPFVDVAVWAFVLLPPFAPQTMSLAPKLAKLPAPLTTGLGATLGALMPKGDCDPVFYARVRPRLTDHVSR